ncbi:protocatechuate 3,4-dioxygenase subunit beta [Maribacter sp. PR1]|uniref:Protocatechuate 3,4-dioxygenase subunit beta n=1 Tax=Maribacter cobaltidurans TaxID=1178778 RepID=A0ABU7IUI8_9FLAO|nr:MULTISPECIES: protocatechuate 3,4-dioxygenase subunit beta [Maribacter]MDC6389255.1 protocatechuate 3,4-dioxygenase subunit beta [Maribacter sp. PR1]MEE1976642.1 protocatechuate 3,4-dioxygenase subunit beta [Maribacter cobaltidurans]
MASEFLDQFDREVQPPYLHEAYKSTLLRAPLQPLVVPPKKEITRSGPLFKDFNLGALDHDLTKNSVKDGEAIGERIVVHGKVTNEKGHPLPHTLIELWQANSAGRYVHKVDQHDAPLDPNFLGTGRCMTDAHGNYKFYTIKPGAYPWGNHPNAWRPNHIHFSLFGGNITSRLITQMYFPGDPLFEHDPIFKAVPPKGRELLISKFDLSITEPNFALGYRFDIVLRGKHATPFENL